MHLDYFDETIFAGEPNEHTFRMICLPCGTFDMGDEYGDLWEDCSPVQKNIQIKPFAMAQYPVTQALWKAVMGNNPSAFQGDNRPVENVSWDDVQEFLKKLNETEAGRKQSAADGMQYRLPSEAQWEYAARAGKNNRLKYAGSHYHKEVGWFWQNSHKETKPVGLKLPNEFGLYDMSGNVWEWCQYTWSDNTAHNLFNKILMLNETTIKIRGGAWLSDKHFTRVANYYKIDNHHPFSDTGFRLSRY